MGSGGTRRRTSARPAAPRPSSTSPTSSRVGRRQDSPLFVPGKVLGTGPLDKKLVVGAFSFSSSARKKIESAGGEALDDRGVCQEVSRREWCQTCQVKRSTDLRRRVGPDSGTPVLQGRPRAALWKEGRRAQRREGAHLREEPAASSGSGRRGSRSTATSTRSTVRSTPAGPTTSSGGWSGAWSQRPRARARAR